MENQKAEDMSVSDMTRLLGKNSLDAMSANNNFLNQVADYIERLETEIQGLRAKLAELELPNEA